MYMVAGCFFFYGDGDHRELHVLTPSVPTRRSADRAAALASRSQHPLAQAILERASGDGIAVNPAVDFQSVTGAGAKGVVDGVELFIGSPQLFAGLGDRKSTRLNSSH